MVIRLEDCIARPPEGGRTFPLSDHLFTVGQRIGAPEGEWAERLAFLAGLLHDAGKARLSWQQYIRSRDPDKGSVPHAVYGAVLFAYCADYLSRRLPLSADAASHYQWSVMRWVRDIMDHHGPLKDIDETSLPWEGHFFAEDLGEMDLAGLQRFLQTHFTELDDLEFSVQHVKTWQKGFRRTWRTWYRTHVRRHAKRETAADQCVRTSTARLIEADRFDAALLEKREMSRSEALKALDQLNEYVTHRAVSASPAQTDVSTLRQTYQDVAVNQFKKHASERFFTLSLPTGMGKTMTALKVALTACVELDKQRIVYVAPYLSILSQATAELRRATGLEVQQHHSLTWSEHREWDEKDILLLESWQAPIVTTTFNQLFRGLFPSRAQETLRLAGLRRAVLLLDEPQIIREAAWFPFLKMLEAAACQLDMQVLFISATMPPLNAISCRPTPLVEEHVVYAPRYDVLHHGTPCAEADVADRVVNRVTKDRQVAVVLNTVEDSSRVYREVKNRLALDECEAEVIHLNGAMTPLHKHVQIQRVKKRLADDSDTRLLVVSTQMIEAGVDISFRAVYRALSIFPSLVQAAGRINRHGQGDRGELIVFPFLRNGEKDTRRSVYRERLFREETDKSLDLQKRWAEHEFIREVDRYYARVFQRMQAEASLKRVSDAARGNWTELAQLTPFEEDGQRVSVFVPWGESFLHTDEALLSEEEKAVQKGIQRLMEQFAIQSVEAIYERYLDRAWMTQLTFVERKQFMGLMQQFIVPIHYKTAAGVVANLRDDPTIKRITSLEEYSDESGLAHHIGNEEDGILW